MLNLGEYFMGVICAGENVKEYEFNPNKGFKMIKVHLSVSTLWLNIWKVIKINTPG